MPKKNRVDCPKDGEILVFDEKKNAWVCPICGWNEPAYNDVNIDSHDQIINNYYQAPSQEKVDNRGSYSQMVERLIAFIKDDDEDEYLQTAVEIRESYPQTYYGQVINAWRNSGGCNTKIFDSQSLYKLILNVESVFVDNMQDTLEEDGDITNLTYEVAWCAFNKLDELGIANQQQIEMLNTKTDLHAYIESLESIMQTLSAITKGNACARAVKYEFEQTHFEQCKEILEMVNKTLAKFYRLDDAIKEYVEQGITKVEEVADVLVGAKQQTIQKPKQTTSGLYAGIVCAVIELLMVVFFLLGIVGGRGDISCFLLLPTYLIHIIPDIICCKRSRTYSTNTKFSLIGAGLSLIMLIIFMSVNNVSKFFVLIPFAMTIVLIINSIRRLPRIIKTHKRIKIEKLEYARISSENDFEYASRMSEVKYSSLEEFYLSFRYNFSDWKKSDNW